MSKIISLSLVVAATLVLAGCKPISPPPAAPGTPAKSPAVAMPKTDDGTMKKEPSGDAMIKKTAPDETMQKPVTPSSYVPYTVAAYNQAKAAGRPILLYFYANWCPLCRPQEPVNVSVFGEGNIAALSIAGFRVNYNDDETDDDERALARQLGVNYQHTFITFGSDGAEIWRTTGTQNREQLLSRLGALR